MEMKGVTVTPAIEKHIEEWSKQEQQKFDKETAARGVPEKFRALFEMTRKAEAVKYCRQLELDDEELNLLILNSYQIGFRHSLRAKEFVPPHLAISDDDISRLKNNPEEEGKRFARKVSAVFKERKRVHVHLFEKGSEWHCFHFTYGDVESETNSHWELGPHVHYVSHLWSGLKKENVWQSLKQRKTMRKAVHIRFHETPLEA